MSTRILLPRTTETIDPEIQAIFDAMLTYMTDQDLPNCNAFANWVGNGTNLGISATQRNGNRFNYTYFIQGPSVSVQPVNPALGPGATMQFSATALNADGTPDTTATFTWSMTPGQPGSIDANGLYTAPATIATQMTSSIVCSLVGQPNAWTTATLSLHP